MTATTIRVQMAQRKDTAANWTAANPILLSGEIGYETDTKKFKIGNGSTNWNSLAYLPIPDGSGNLTITGNLEIGSTGSLTFEGSTADGFETTLAVTNPTADRTITLPDRSGTVITSGDTGTVTSTMILDGTIVNGDVNASAAIAGTKITPDFGAQTITTTGVVSAAVGAAATPSITFTGDTNTGIYSPGADQVAISTGGSGRLFVDASGNVGVGAASTGSDLRVAGLTGTSILEVFGADSDGFADLEIKSTGTSGASRLYFSDTAAQSGLIRYSHNTNSLEFSTAGTERLRITSAGLVGVGTSSPSTNLDIVVGSGTATQKLGSSSVSGGSYLNLHGASTSKTWFIGANYNFAGVLEFTQSTANGGTTPSSTPAMVLSAAGNVGINTSSPNGSLDINNGAAVFSNSGTYIGGIGRANGLIGGTTSELAITTSAAQALLFGINNTERARIDSSGRVGLGTTSPQEELHIVAASQPYIQVQSTGGVTGSAYYGYNSSTGSASIESTGSIRFAIPGSEAVRIDSSGRVGIGTSSPSNGLQVTQNISRSTPPAAGASGHEFALGSSGYGIAAGTTTGGSSYLASTRWDGSAVNYSLLLNPNGGSVGIGTTAPQYKLQVSQSASAVCFGESSSVATVIGTNAAGTASQELSLRGFPLTFTGNGGGGSEAARIDSSGRLLVGTSSALGNYHQFNALSTASNYLAIVGVHNATNDDVRGIYSFAPNCTTADGFLYLGAVGADVIKFAVRTDGDVQNVNNAYGAYSDARLKENIVDAASQWDDIKNLQVRKYNFKENTGHATHAQIGLIAQEVELVSPGLVGESQAEPLGNSAETIKTINYSVLYMKAVKALQEAMERIEQLEAEMVIVKAQLS